MVGGFLLIYEFLLSKWAMGCIMGREAIWRGAEYNQRGEEQLADYLDAYHLKRGYMVSFNFNKKKQIGVKRISLGDKVLIEAVV